MDREEKRESKQSTKYKTLADIITSKGLWQSLPELKEEHLERYPIFLANFAFEWEMLGLPKHLMTQSMIRKLPLVLRNTIMEQNIETRIALEEFLQKQIFAPKVSENTKAQLAEENLTERSKDEKLLYTGLILVLQGIQKYFFQNPTN